MKKTFYAAIVIALSTLAACKGDEVKVTKEPLQVTTETVAMSTDYSAASYVGVVEAENSSLVSFTGTGAIVQMAVSEGQHVRKGQLIARLDEEQAKNLLSQAEYAAMQAQKTEVMTSNATEQARYTEDQAQIGRQQAQYTSEQARIAQEQAQNAVAGAKSTLDQALDAKQRMQTLHDNNSLPDMKWVEVLTKVDQAQAAYNTAVKNLETARVAYQQTQEGQKTSDVVVAQAAVGSRQAQNTAEQSQVATKQAGVNVNIARKNLKDCAIYAPCDGVVVARYLNAGEVALPSQPIVKIMSTGNVKVTVSVPELDLGKIENGMRTVVRCAALEGEEWVSTSLTKVTAGDALTHTYKVMVNVAGAGDKLLPGMVCNVTFANDTATPAITAPIKAVQQRSDGTHFVWVAKGNKAHRQTVTLGETVGNRIIITSGLEEGAKLITEGYQKVDEGGKVKLD